MLCFVFYKKKMQILIWALLSCHLRNWWLLCHSAVVVKWISFIALLFHLLVQHLSFFFFFFACTPSSGGFINETGSSDWLTHHIQIIMKQHFSTASTAAAAPKRGTAQFNASSLSAFFLFFPPCHWIFPSLLRLWGTDGVMAAIQWTLRWF